MQLFLEIHGVGGKRGYFGGWAVPVAFVFIYLDWSGAWKQATYVDQNCIDVCWLRVVSWVEEQAAAISWM